MICRCMFESSVCLLLPQVTHDLGSGTTALACIDCGNDFIGIEKNKEYFEIAKARIKRRNDGKEN